MPNYFPPFVQDLVKRDPELYEVVVRSTELASAPGALDAKTKLLISLALDAYIGAERGVASLAKRAREAGATDQEITEVLRISYNVCASRTLIASGSAFPKE